MIHFKCHRCKRQIAVPEGYVGKKVKCPACSIVTIVPDIPGAQEAKARQAAAQVPPPPPVPVPPPPPLDPLDQLAAAATDDVIDEGYGQRGSPPPLPSQAGRAGEGQRGYPMRRRRPRHWLVFLILILLGIPAGVGVGHLIFYINAQSLIDQIRLVSPDTVTAIAWGNSRHHEMLIYGGIGGLVVGLVGGLLIMAVRQGGR
ncbi:MAG: hypothetical protein WD768_04760 [Phycisphaeraceae bacterium]